MNPLPASSVALGFLATLLLLATAFLVGRKSCRSLQSTESPAEQLVLDFAIGLNLIGWIGVSLGQLGLLKGLNSVFLLMGLSLLCVFGHFREIRKQLKQRILSQKLSTKTPATRFAQACMLAILLLTLGPAIAYPDGWDELVYHVSLPARWLTDGWPAFYVDLPYSAFPSMAEILFWLVSPIEFLFVPRMVTWLCWSATLVLLKGILQRFVNETYAIALTAAFALSTSLLMIVNNCYAESLLILNFAAMLFILFRQGDPEPPSAISRWGIALGILAGGAVAVKLTGVSIVAVALIFMAWRICREPLQFRRHLTAALWFSIAVMIVATPYYIRPWVATGNPFYPYFSHWFSDNEAVLEMSRYHHAIGSSFGIHDWRAFLAGPFLLAFDNMLYDGKFGSQTFLLLGLAGWELFRAVRNREWKSSPTIWLSLAGFTLYCFWFATAQQSRFAIPVWMILVIVAASGLKNCSTLLQRWAVGALLITTFVSAPWSFSGYYFSTWVSAVGLISPFHHVDEGTGFGYLEVVEPLRSLPAGSRVMLLVEHRGLYLPPNHVIGTPFFQAACFTPPERFINPDDVLSELSRNQVSHLLMAKSVTGPDRVERFIERFEPLLLAIEKCNNEGKLTVVWESDAYYLMRVSSQ